MSPEMEGFLELMRTADTAHKEGRIAAFDILMADVYDAFEELPRDDREWLERHSEVAG